jgi:hypothetical protein
VKKTFAVLGRKKMEMFADVFVRSYMTVRMMMTPKLSPSGNRSNCAMRHVLPIIGEGAFAGRTLDACDEPEIW